MNSDLCFALFDTAIGHCGVVWSGRGVVGVQVPARSDSATRDHVLRRFPGALETSQPPAPVQRAIDDMVALLGGEPRDLADVMLDQDGVADFNRRVYQVARRIPAGCTLSYGEIAARLGDKNLAREVEQALSQNPTPIIVPCHRVLAAGGKMGGFSAPGGVRTKLRLLTIEGAQTEDGPALFDRLPWVAAPNRRL